jgi:probable phosphoglycerate mutase
VRLLLVRHGESVCGVNGIVGGERGCTGLTERGLAQARALADRLAKEGFSTDVLLASTLPRAHQTAEPIGVALGLEPSSDPDLVEFIPGEIDGTPWDDWERFDVVAEPDRPMSAGGETLNIFRTRVTSLLDRLASLHNGKTVVAVCHGGIVYMSFRVLMGIPTDRELTADVDNTSITEWRYADRGWHLVRFNDVAHLHGSDLLESV